MILTDLPAPTRAQSPQCSRRRCAGATPAAAARTGVSGIRISSAELPARRAPQVDRLRGPHLRRHAPLGRRRHLRSATPGGSCGPSSERPFSRAAPGHDRRGAVAIRFECLPR